MATMNGRRHGNTDKIFGLINATQNIKGVESKNVNLARPLFYLHCPAAAMVMPERDTPGIMASACETLSESSFWGRYP